MSVSSYSYNALSLAGVLFLLAVAWACSKDRRNMNWRVVGWGVGLQFAIALLIFQVPAGAKALRYLNGVVLRVLDCATAGTRFVFGYLVSPAPDKFILVVHLATIVFFSALVAVLYYWRVIPTIVRCMAWLFTRLMRISGAEALCAGSNFFVGIESALTVKPYLGKMTRSELCTVLTAGMSTVSANVLAVYVFALEPTFPTIAAHLVSASLLSVPAAVVMSKILMPESQAPDTLGRAAAFHYEREGSLFEAVIGGANSGVRLIVGIVALLIAILGLVALVDLFLGAGGGWVNGATGWQVDWSLQGLLGYVLRPFVFMLGVPWSDARLVAQLVGERALLTEIPAYMHLADLMREGAFSEPRSAVVAAYALCGFAHIASVGIFVGGVAALAPERTKDLADLGMRALLGATLACLLTGAVAGVFFAPGASVLTL